MGRPRLADQRPPLSGHARLKAAERDAAAVALEARRRLYGAPMADAAQPEWETILGRLHKWGDLNRSQYEAGCLYREMRSSYDRVMQARQALRVAERGGYDSSDGTDPAYVAWAARIRDQHSRCVLALMATMDLDAVRAIEMVVVEDMSAPELLGSLRLALNAVGKVLK